MKKMKKKRTKDEWIDYRKVYCFFRKDRGRLEFLGIEEGIKMFTLFQKFRVDRVIGNEVYLMK